MYRAVFPLARRLVDSGNCVTVSLASEFTFEVDTSELKEAVWVGKIMNRAAVGT
jgi:hypothetical protein